jgi:homoserine O-acetyltransferase
MMEKFGRDLKAGDFALGNDAEVEFQVQSYLRYQGDTFSRAFDANSYILMTRALDYFDLAREYRDDPVTAFLRARSKFLVISFTSDWRFSPLRSREIVNALIGARRTVSYAEIESPHGHDAFLVPSPRYDGVFRAYMQRIARECC